MAMSSRVPQSANQRRPSCQRNDSPNARPVMSVCGCSAGIEDFVEGITTSSVKAPIYQSFCGRALWPPMHQRAVLAAGGGTLTDTMHVVWALVTVLLMTTAMGFVA